MTVDRRALLGGALLGGALLGGMATAARAEETPAPAPAAAPKLEERIAARALENRHRLDFSHDVFSGPAFDLLVREGKAAQFFLIGEEHGVAENPKLVSALFRALRPDRLGIEISPPMAEVVDEAAARGRQGLADLFADPAATVAFYGMAEEAQMLAAVRAEAGKPVLWGVDYEVGADRRLIALLEAARKPAAAAAPLAALKAASGAAWAKYGQSRNIMEVFTFSGDPALVRAVRAAWPRPDRRSDLILTTLEETLEINSLWSQRKGWASNERRTAFMRQSFLRHWRAAKAAGETPRVMMKMGASHMVRGRSFSEVWDLGTLLPELAQIEGGHAFSMMLLPGAASPTAVLDPTTFRYAPGDPKDHYMEGLDPLVNAAFPDAFTLIDLRPIRPLLSAARSKEAHPELMRTVHGFDTLLVMSGSTPSANLL